MCVTYCRYRRGETAGLVCGGGNLRGVFRRGRGGADHVLDLQKDPPWRLQTQQAG